MNLIFFIRLIIRNLALLIAVPVVLAITVFFFTQNETKYYSSKTTVYTGITSGYNIESGQNSKVDYFATNNAFDNLVNIINSRETMEEVILRLLAQHLYMEKPDPKFISKKNFEELQQIVPDEIRQMVNELKKKYPPGSILKPAAFSKTNNTLKENTSTESIPAQQFFHFVKPGETLYSISKKYNVPVEQLQKINDLNNNDIKVDDRLLIIQNQDKQNNVIFREDTNYYYIPRKDESILSIATRFSTLSSNIIEWNNLNERIVPKGQKIIVGGIKTKKLFSDSIITDLKNVKNTSTRDALGSLNFEAQGFSVYDKAIIDSIVTRLYQYKNASDTGFIYELLNYQHPHYSIKALSTIKPKRIGNSDLIEISFESDDPGLCQQTLLILIDVFIKNYKTLKVNQTDAVVNYFQKQVNQATRRLQLSEDKLLRFNEDNSIINYYEQTKFIAEQKEDLDMGYQEEKMNRASAEAALQKIENRLNLRGEINLASSEIVKKRKELGDITSQIAMTEAFQPDTNAWELVYLRNKAAKIKNELESAVTELYSFNNTIQGMPIQDLLQEWLTKVMEFEESDAKIKVFEERILDFRKKYDQFAPLGATLKRIEREINVAEQEYLALLNSLNEAKLKQQNIEFSSNIKPVDLPFYPIQPQSSKRKLLIIAAAFAGFIMVLALIILLEFFDNTLKTPENAEKVLTIPFGTVFPLIPEKFKKVDYPLMLNRLTDILFQNIQLHSGKDFTNSSPLLIAFISTRKEEGKTTIAEKLFKRLRNFEEKTALVTPGESFEPEANDNIFSYKAEMTLSSANSINDLVPGSSAKFSSMKYIIVELPALLYNNISSSLISRITSTILTVRANRTWSKADKRALDMYMEMTEGKLIFALNGTSLDALETVIGEIPRKRPWIRRAIKNILSFQIHNKAGL